MELITDTSVWIDLYRGGVLEQVFRLPYRWVVSDLLLHELREPSFSDLLLRGLVRRELSSDELTRLDELAVRHRQVSVADLSALILCKAKSCVLLTGDKHLRRIAEEAGVDLHGTLWILDEMVRSEFLTPRQAEASLRTMLASGSRFPRSESQERLKRWKSEMDSQRGDNE